MDCFPGVGMAGGTVATGCEVFSDRQASQAAVGIVTGAAAIMGICCSTDQGIVVAVAAAGCPDLNQTAVVRGISGMEPLPGIGMAGGTLTATGRNAGIQGRNITRMAVETIILMSNGHRSIGGRARIMTVHTVGRSANHITERHMVDTTVYGQLLVRMAIQTMGRVGSSGDGVDNILPRAVVAGDTGPDPVGGNIMRDTFDFGPGRHGMTVTAGEPRRIEREVVGTDFDRMSEIAMVGGLISMAIGTGDLGPVQPILNHLPND